MADYDEFRAVVAAELARHRAIIHIDLDCFYCQVEQLRLALSPDVPLAVQQWQGLIAVNYPARRRGVKRMDTVWEAREKCPELVLVHVPTFTDTSPAAYHANPSVSTHKASLDEYRRVSRRVMDVFKRLCPTMGKASIDEAYLDVSGPMRSAVLADLDRGALELVDGRGAAAAAAMAGGLAFSAPIYDEDSAGEAELPLPAVYWVAASRKGKEAEPATTGTGTVTEYGVLVGDAPQVSYSWGDLLLRYAAVFARDARSTLFQELGYRASAGIAHNRFLAKIGSGLHKPDQQTVFPQSQVGTFMYSFPIASIPSLGGKLGALAVAAFGAQTAGDLAGYTLEQMALKLGAENAQHVYNRCRGIDDSPVVDSKEPASFASTKNFPQPVTGMAQLDRWISINSADIWARVSEEWEERRRWPRSLTVSYTTSGQQQRSKTVQFPPRDPRGAVGSPDAVAAATHTCLVAIASGVHYPLFPLSAIALTAKSFQRGAAGAALMEKWLSRPKTGPPGAAPQTQDASDNSDNSDNSDSSDSDNGGYDANTNGDNDDDDDDDDGIPKLQQPRLTTMLMMASQPTMQIPPDQRPASPLNVTPSAYDPTLPIQPVRAEMALPFQPPVALSSAITQMTPGFGISPAQYDAHFRRAIPSYIPQPDLVTGSDAESCDSDMSLLRTPRESESGESGGEGEGEEADESEEDASDSEVGADRAAAPAAAPPPPAGPMSPSRRLPEVYIQPNVDQDSAARYGEGYRHMNLDPNDDGGLELAASARAQARGGDSSGVDGFIPALIAATRRKREIQVVSFLNSVDHPEDAIEVTRDDLDDVDEEKARRSRVLKAGESSRMAGALGGTGRSAEDEDDDEDCSSDEGVDEVLDISVRAMMESIMASHAVMQIRCPQCPDGAPTVSSREWDTHRDWHMARRLQERELRHETAARRSHTASAARSDRPPSKRAKRGGGASPRRRQQTITEVWR
ncbi:N-acetyltransferase eso1 [Coemansia spiralis]|nr:N-acetyltransferase eso1 [Coemansia spiralis]